MLDESKLADESTDLYRDPDDTDDVWTDGILGLQERIKTGDVRDNSKINPDALMHRFYGVANINGVDCRVMTLMKEENKAKRGNDIHSYEVQKIEVLDEETPNTSNGVGTLNSELEGYPLAKLLQNLGKSYEKDKNLLNESKLADESTDLYREPDDTDDVWTDGILGLQERIKTDDVRDNSKINPDALMRRFYGVANIDGVDYRVMTLMKEENKAKRGNGIHAYEVSKIEVLDGQTTKPLSVSSRKSNTPNDSHGLNSELEAHDLNDLERAANSLLPLAKVIKNLEKSYDKGKNLLDESKLAD